MIDGTMSKKKGGAGKERSSGPIDNAINEFLEDVNASTRDNIVDVDDSNCVSSFLTPVILEGVEVPEKQREMIVFFRDSNLVERSGPRTFKASILPFDG